MRLPALRCSAITSAACVLLAASAARADGFRNPPPGAPGLALGSARIALADGAESLFFNPANAAGVDAAEVAVAIAVARQRTDFRGFDGRRGSSEDEWQLLPNLAVLLPVGDGKTALGFSVTTPFGQASEWDPAGPFGAAIPYYARMQFVTYGPAIGVRLSDRWSAGAAVGASMTRLDLKQVLPWSAITGAPLPDGEAKVETEGSGFGATVGLSWRPAEGHRLGAIYRSPVRIEYEGDLTLTGYPAAPGMPPALSGATVRGDIETTFTFPEMVTVGYGWEPFARLALEVNAEWLRWSRYGEPSFRAGAFSALLPTGAANNWSDTWSFSAGAAWNFAGNWTLRAGYARLESPVPDRSFSPILPDSDRDIYSIGLGYRTGPHRFDAAVALTRADDRRRDPADGPPLAGTYEFSSDLFALSYAVEFR